MTRLVVHIGGGKCGSTAIQQFLRNNRDRLQSEGFIVPGERMTTTTDQPANQVWFFQGLLNYPGNIPLGWDSLGPIGAARLRGLLNKCLGDYHQTKRARVCEPTILLSAENLSNPSGLHRVFTNLTKDFDVEIVLYVRRQEESYMSAWQQWFVKTESNLDDWITNNTAFFANWKETIQSWETVCARKFSVRIYDRNELVNSDIVHDYCDVLRIDPTIFRLPDGDANVTTGVHIAHLMHDCREMFEGPHDVYFQNILARRASKSAAKHPGESLFSTQQLEAVREKHAKDNTWVKERYFPNLDRSELFGTVDHSKARTPDWEEMNRRNLEVLHDIVDHSPNTAARVPDIDLSRAPDRVRRDIAEATMAVIKQLKSEEAV